MALAIPTVARRFPAFLAISLSLLALVGPARANAKVQVVAKVSPDTPAVQVTARTSPAAKRIFFLVDGHKQSIGDSVEWRNGRKGVLDGKRFGPGPHRLAAVAIHPGGAVSRGVRIIELQRKPLAKRPRKRNTNIGLEPARPTTEPRSQAGIVFNGGFDNGFTGWHVQALPYGATTFGQGFSGGAARFEVRQGDVEPETGSNRAEVSGPTFDEGQELFVRDTIRVPSSSSFDSSWQLIQQLREEDWGGSPGMAVFLEDTRQLKIGAGDSSPMYWQGPKLQPDRWYDLVYRVKLSQDWGVGFVEVWLDGVPQTMVNGETRIYGQTIQRPQNYIKAGLYRSSSSTGTSVVEHDNVIVGTSYEAVMSAG
jgi:polysaccharide lyase-like protein